MDRWNQNGQEVLRMKRKLEKLLVSLSDDITGQNVNSACCWLFYQSKIPDKLKKKYKK